MASNTRSGRRATSQNQPTQTEAASLSNLERLLFAQAVYEFGANAWPSVTKLLAKHPLMSNRPRSFFNQQSCSAIYHQMLNDANLTSLEDIDTPRSTTNLKLAQRHYQVRVAELRDLILAAEVKFKTLVSEIDEIRAGKWDDRFKTKATGHSIQDVEERAPNSGVPDINHLSGFKGPHKAEEVEHVGQPNALTAPNTVPSQINLENQHSGTPPSQKEHAEAVASDISPEVLIPLQAIQDSARVVVSEVESDLSSTIDGSKVLQDPEPRPTPADHPPTKSSANDDVMDASQNESHQEKEPLDQTSTVVDHATEAFVNSVLDVDDTVGPSTRRRDSKRVTSTVESIELNGGRKRSRDDTEILDEDELSIAARRRRDRQQPSEEQVAVKRFQNVIGMLHSQISAHRNGNIFHNPIKNSEAPDYHEIVKRPMDLKTIKGKIKDGGISNSLEFQRDVYLMFANAMMYNRPNSDIYTMTEEMMLQSEQQISSFRQTEGFVQRTHRP